MNQKRVAFIAFFIAFPIVAGVFPIKAASTARAAGDCPIMAADVGAVTAAAAQGLTAELAARKALLVRTISCAQADARTLQTNLNALTVSGDAKTIQVHLSGQLDDAMTFYNIELGKVDGTGIAGTQAVAREVLAWRDANYTPLAASVANLTLWAQNQNLFMIADGRLSKVKGVGSFIEQAAPNTDLESDLAAAETLMQSADDENHAALNAMLQSLPPDQTLSLIQQSLQSLSSAYQKFFDLSTVIQTLLSATPAQQGK